MTPTTAPPLKPGGATFTDRACRRIYPVVTAAITNWNAANRRGVSTALSRATQGLTRAAGAVVPIARGSGDGRLLTLTTAVATQLRKTAADHAAGRDVDGSGLNQATSALWTYCRSPR